MATIKIENTRWGRNRKDKTGGQEEAIARRKKGSQEGIQRWRFSLARKSRGIGLGTEYRIRLEAIVGEKQHPNKTAESLGEQASSLTLVSRKNGVPLGNHREQTKRK